MNRLLHLQLFAFAVSAASLLYPSSPCLGQALSFRQTPRSGRFIEAPRNLQQQLREAQRSLEKGEGSDAVVRLGDLLARSTPIDSDLRAQDFFVDIEDSQRSPRLVRNSLLRQARDRIGELSAKELETYELRNGALANKMLEDASLARDWEMLRQVRRQYFHTLAGYRASYLLAQKELYGGHPLAASLLLDDVVSMQRARDHLGDAVVEMHAVASRMAKRPETDSDAGQSARAKQYDRSFEKAGGDSPDYPFFGGGLDRNESSAGEMPLTNERWSLPTTGRTRQDRALQKVSSELASAGKLPPPSWMPLLVGDQLIMRTTERVVGVDYRTGKRIWTYPWFSPEFNEERASFQETADSDGPGDLLSQRVWNDLPYGQMTTDGERVYIVDNLGEVEMARIGGMGFGGTRPADTKTNTLVALELSTEGKLQWRLGAGAYVESELSNAFFLGPPLPLDGRLYVMAELAGDISLFCLDPNTGSELWRQQLVAVESGNVSNDPIRRIAGATPTYHEGVLICPTGAGAVVALDLHDRMLRWGFGFDRASPIGRSMNSRNAYDASQLMQRWHSGNAIAHGDTVLVTPIESDRLYGIDLVTGKPRFKEKNRVHLRYLAGARDNRFYIVSADQVRAFDIQNGDLLWTSPSDMLSAGQQIIGRGVFGDDDYLIPITSNQLVRISLETGEVLQRRTTRYSLGNLIAAGGEIIAQGVSAISVAYGEESLEPLVDKMLQKDPNDLEALVRKSELLIQHRKRREALELLAKARAIEPANAEVHMLSVTAMLGAFRDDLQIDPELVDTLDRLIERDEQRADFLALRVEAAVQDGDYAMAITHLLSLSQLLGSVPELDPRTEELLSDRGRYCSLNSWIAGRVVEILDQCDAQQLETVNRLVTEAVEPLRLGPNKSLARLIRHFGPLEGIEGLRSELSRRLAQSGSWFALERLSLGQKLPTAEHYAQMSDERLLSLASVFAESRYTADAAEVITALRSRDLDDKTSKLVDDMETLSKRVPSKPQWSNEVNLSWVSQQIISTGFNVPAQRFAATRHIAGKQFENWVLLGEGSSPLAMRDPNKGSIRQIVLESVDRSLDTDKEAIVCGSFMVIVLPTELIGVNLRSVVAADGEAVVWRRSLSGDGGAIARRRSDTNPFEAQIIKYAMVNTSSINDNAEFRLGPVLGDRIIMGQGSELIALDLETKEPLWRNSDAPSSGAILEQDGRVAVVSPSSKKVDYFNLLDGRKLESKPWTHGDRWAAAGRNVLCYAKTDEKRVYVIRLVDAFTGEVKLEMNCLGSNRTNADIPCGYGRVVNGRYLVTLQSTGKAAVWDLKEAREVSTPELPAYQNLLGLQAMVLDGQIVLLPKRRDQRPRLAAGGLQTGDSKYHVTTHGMYAIDLESGDLNWSKDFEEPWGCTIHHPAGTPIITLSRSRSTYGAPSTSRQLKLDVLALDVRDGKELSKALDRQIRSRMNILQTRQTIQSGLSRVIVQIGGELLTYRFVRQDAAKDDAQGQAEPATPAEIEEYERLLEESRD